MTQTVATDAAAVGVSLPALDDDVSFAVMEELASEIDFEEAGAAGLMVVRTLVADPGDIAPPSGWD